METIAVFVDDADHARHLLTPLLAQDGTQLRWVVVACPPRLTHRIGKWVSHSSRVQWRDHWMRTLRQQLEPLFGQAKVVNMEWLMASGPLDQLSARLRLRLGTDLRLLDARRSRLGAAHAALNAEQPATEPAMSRWAVPIAVTSSLAVVLAMTD